VTRKPAKRVVHVVGSNTWKPQFAFLGSTKDIVGRRDYFAARGIECRELVAQHRSDDLCLKMLREMDLSDVDAVMFEHPRYPKSLAYLKREHPAVRRVIRGHNAELLHQLQTAAAYLRCGLGTPRWRRGQALHALQSAWQRFRFDWASARLSNAVLAISEWEARHYWSRLTAGSKILYCPYFLPAKYLPPPPVSADPPRRCLTATSADWSPLAHHAARVFVELVEALPEDQLDGWEFVISGELGPRTRSERLAATGRVTMLGVVDDPLALMAGMRALAHLSNLGMGFKTKLLDSVLSNGGWLIVPSRLCSRLPKALQAHAIVVEPLSAEGLTRALRTAAATMPPESDINGQLKESAFLALDRALGYAAD
jgi:hypothetical protein